MSGRRKKGGMPSGELHTHRPHVATTMERSADGRRALTTLAAVDTSTPGLPDWHAEDFGTAQALEGPDFSYLLGDDSNWGASGGMEDDLEEERDGIMMAAPTEQKVPNFERWQNAVSMWTTQGPMY
jgi:hypothetical protein